MIDERDFIARSQGGDLEAFNRLVEQYQGQVYNVAFRMLGSQASAEDVAQDSFISAFKHIREFRGEKFKSWLLRITTNACYDHLRSVQRRKSTSLEALQDNDPSWEPASATVTPEQAVLSAELSRSINDAFRVLSPDQRAVVILSDVEGFTYEEIAEATGASLGTVKSRLSRARAGLRDYFLAHGELLPSHFRQKSKEET